MIWARRRKKKSDQGPSPGKKYFLQAVLGGGESFRKAPLGHSDQIINGCTLKELPFFSVWYSKFECSN